MPARWPQQGDALKRARMNVTATPDAAAAAAGVSLRSWQRFEDGSRRIPDEVLLRFAAAFQLTQSTVSVISAYSDMQSSLTAPDPRAADLRIKRRGSSDGNAE